MANTRRIKRHDTTRRTAGPVPGHGDMEDLREALTAAGAPEEVLRLLDDVHSPQELLDELIGDEPLPSPEEALDGLLEHWRPLLKNGCDPLAAELTGYEFVGLVRETTPDETDLPDMLAALIGQAADRGGPEALAMLRVLAAVGPAEVRPVAAESADRLAAGGLKDRPWVTDLGRPRVGECFGYRDPLGSQETLAMTFAYGRRRHALAVLIDHDLGGGVKDCFPADRPELIRNNCEQMADQHGLEFREYEPAEARAILETALAKEPCPVEPDQVQDVADYLPLLRARLTSLSGTEVQTTVRTAPSVHRLKITLRGSKPPIWRRLEVPSRITLEKLHGIIQAAFGWENAHLWVFSTPLGEYGISDPELGHRSAARKRLDDVAPLTGDRIAYTYDFGDGWEHLIAVEDVLDAEPGVAYPRCLTGRRAGPPEDCGGVWGYSYLLDVLADPDHEEHVDRLEWLGLNSPDEFDPAAFDRDKVNESLSALAKILVKEQQRSR